MFSTAVVVTLFVVVTAIAFLLWAAFLYLGTRWAKIEGATSRRVLAIAGLAALVHLVCLPLYMSLPSSVPGQVVSAVAQLGEAIVFPCWLIRVWFKVSRWRALQAWSLTLLSNVVVLLFLFGVFRPYLAEAFTAPTNSMAPTLLGYHDQAPCPRCGSLAYCSPLPPGHEMSPEGELMICLRNFHECVVHDFSPDVHQPDRFLVTKFLTPRRWDIIVFQYPGDPKVNYVKRLVGLPGEEVCIKDGRVWIDGHPLAPPDAINGVRYASEIEGVHQKMWGTSERPAKLGLDEYFVLGDFSQRAKDSRLWEKGAPGHPPYAVPASYVRGVVTHTYWPPSRWRVLR